MTFALNLSGLAVAVEHIEGNAEQGLTNAAEHLLTQANLHVPHDEGDLERSGSASVGELADGQLVGAVSYDTPYAQRQHEDLTLHHGGKGQAKWLENTMAEQADTVGQIIAQAVHVGGAL